MVNKKIEPKKNVAQLLDNPAKIKEFKPLASMEKWLDIAIRLQTDNLTLIAKECGMDRSAWYEWMSKPGFEDWYFENYKKKRSRWLPTLDAHGMRRAAKDHKYWQDMNKKIGELKDEPNSLTQVNLEQNFTPGKEVDPDELANEMVSLIEGIESIRPEEVQPDSTTGTAEEGKVITSPN